MNKASVIGLLTLMSISSFAMAAYTGPQEQNKVSVAQLKDLADDSWATLEGKLVKHLAARIHVPRRQWRGGSGSGSGCVARHRGGPDDLIRIRGEVTTAGTRPKWRWRAWRRWAPPRRARAVSSPSKA